MYLVVHVPLHRPEFCVLPLVLYPPHAENRGVSWTSGWDMYHSGVILPVEDKIVKRGLVTDLVTLS